MENLTPEERARLKKASTDRLRFWLARSGMDLDQVAAMSRDQLLEAAASQQTRPVFEDEAEAEAKRAESDVFNVSREDSWQAELSLRQKELAVREQEIADRQIERELRLRADRTRNETETERFNLELSLRQIRASGHHGPTFDGKT